MLQYLIIQLDDTSVSYCHYNNHKVEHKLISLEDLKAGILYAMKENLMVQMVYPDYQLPEEYEEEINTIDHIKIKPLSQFNEANIVVVDKWKDITSIKVDKSVIYVLRTDKTALFANYKLTDEIIEQVSNHLPSQPWPTNIHKTIAQELNLPDEIVSNTIGYLIYSKKFNHQVYGYVFDEQGNVIAEGEHNNHTIEQAKRKKNALDGYYYRKYGF